MQQLKQDLVSCPSACFPCCTSISNCNHQLAASALELRNLCRPAACSFARQLAVPAMHLQSVPGCEQLRVTQLPSGAPHATVCAWQDVGGDQYQAWSAPAVPELLVARVVDALLDECATAPQSAPQSTRACTGLGQCSMRWESCLAGACCTRASRYVRCGRPAGRVRHCS